MTEKDYNPHQKMMKTMQKQKNAAEQKIETPVKEEKKVETKATKVEEVEKTEKKEEKKVEKKEKKEKKIKKDEAVINGISLPISTKDSVAICKFIKKKSIRKAIADLEEVLKFKKAIPMKGEIPHRKGKIMSGRYPIKAIGFFIKMLKNLQANSNVNGLEEPIINEAVSNKASQPYGRFGSVRKKRTHIKIKAIEKKPRS